MSKLLICSRIVMLCAILFMGMRSASAQIGTPFIINFPESSYASESYISSPQNWDFVQDSRGLIYTANSSGILEYDGYRWRMVNGTAKKFILDLARDSSGRIFGGGRNELGYLGIDSTGNQAFRSLLSALPDSVRQFGQMQSVIAGPSGVYFVAPKHVFLWKDNAFQIWNSPTQLNRGFLIDGEIMIQQAGTGLVQPTANKLSLYPGSEACREIEIRAIVPLAGSSSALLLISKGKGLFRLNSRGLSPLPSPLSNRKRKLLVLDAIPLSNGEIAIAAYGDGVFIIRTDGSIRTQIRKRDGLLDDNVIALRTDTENGIWAGLGKGISRINYPSSLSQFGSSYRLKGIPNCATWHLGELYIGTTSGLFRYDPESQATVFDTLAGEQFRLGVFDLLSVNNQLLIAAPTGTYSLQKGKFTRITSAKNELLYADPSWPNRVFMALPAGIGMIQLTGNAWQLEGTVAPLTGTLTGITKGPDQALWVSQSAAITRVVFPDQPDLAEAIVQPIPIDTAAGIQPQFTGVHSLNENILFSTDKGIYRYDPAQNQVVADSTIIPMPPGKSRTPVNLLTPDREGNLWFTSGKRRWKSHSGNNDNYETAEESLKSIEGQQVWDMYSDPDGIIWMGANEGLFRFDPAQSQAGDHTFHALIRSASLPGDSVIFKGKYFDPHPRQSGATQPISHTFPYGASDLQFSFSATTYAFPDKTEFSYRLEGYDRSWSPWRTGIHTERYTNLKEGIYQFKVRAKNLPGEVSEEDQFSFQILPPWYRTWWSQILFLLLMGGLAYLVFRYATYLQERKSLRKQRSLEAKLEQEQRVSEQLQLLDKLKDEFLANTSHELRTPLNGIIGIAEGIIDQPEISQNEMLRQNMGMVIASGKRLSNLVNDLLDFSQLKTQHIQLRLRPVDMRSLADIVLNICRPLIYGKNLQLINHIPESLPPVEADENRLEQILLNLMGNAIKFTQTGNITLTAEVSGPMIEIAVTDTGIGIPEAKQSAIFQSFEQGDGSIAREYGGTGLGLSITRQLVQLHGGDISVSSQPGEGSVFRFTLPISHDDQVVKQETRASEKVAQIREMGGVPETKDARFVPASDTTINILIVDDEPINQQVLKNHLADSHYHLVSAMNGDEALRILKGAIRFDLVLLDIMMPRMSGYEVCQRIREQFLPSELPVIMITAKNQVKDLVEGFSYGANDYLAKPFSKSEFLARIKMHLNLFSINKATARFVPYEFLRSLGKESILDVQLGDQTEKTVTVLFIDIRAYTTLSEQMTPEDNFRFLNGYLGRIGPLISDNRGFVNQYYGDGIMALFLGSPEDAIIASINIRLRLAQYNREREEQGRVPIATGTGIHTGSLILGILGDEMHMDAGVVSDTVNTASRMEGLTKIFGVPTIVSQDSVNLLHQADHYNYRFLGNVMVKGKVEAIGIYEFFDGESAEIVELMLALQPRFEAGIDHYFAKEFQQAATAFEEVLAKNPGDKPSQYYLAQSQRYQHSGVPDDWTGVEFMGQK